LVELRKTIRLPLVLSVRAGTHPAAATGNVSQGGMFIQTEEVFAAGQTVEVELSFPGLLERQLVTGIVAWCRKASGTEPAGIGVAVTEAEQERQPLLRDLVDAALADHEPLPVPGDSYRILVADDSVNSAELYAHALRRFVRKEWGPERAEVPMDVAENGERALALLRQYHHALLLTDLFMPVMDGFRLIKEARADPSLAGLRILVLSAGDEDSLDRAMSLGADGIVRKPVKLEDLMSTVRALLRLAARKPVSP